MPELDAEHRNQMAEAVHRQCCGCAAPRLKDPRERQHMEVYARKADALAPLVAGWIAEERERARFNDEVRREQLRMARADALREAADNIHEVSGHSAGVPVWRSQVADWLNDRADRGGDDG